MSKKIRSKRKQSPPARQVPWLWLAAGAALLLVAGGLAVIWFSSGTDPGVAPEIAGAPKLVVDQTIVDEGYLKYNTPVQSAFRLSNVGDQPLKILGEPQVVLAAGC
jgi:hypothetical protein